MKLPEISTRIKRLATLEMPVEALKVLLLDLAVELDQVEARLSLERDRKLRGKSKEQSGKSAETPRKAADIPASRVEDNSSSFLLTTEEERKNPPPSPSKASLDPEGFPEFWEAYPKRDGDRDRKGAMKAFRAALKRASLSDLISGARAYAADCTARGKAGTEFVKQARSWLNADGWTEHYGKANGTANGASNLTDSERQEILARLRA